MDTKRNDDYVLRMPGSKYEGQNVWRAKHSKNSQHVRLPAVTESMSKLENNPQLSIIAYCLSSISMTVVNKYVVSGSSWNMTFFFLAVQVRPFLLAAYSSTQQCLTMGNI